MRILGIDPGLQVCGYAVVDKANGVEKLVEAGVFRSDSSKPLETRLNQIARDIRTMLENFKPEIIAVEQLYSHYNHPQTAVLMGHARGVILQQAAAQNIAVRNFAATKIKKSLTGNGRAGKQQMQRAIQSAFNLRKLPEPPDVADAIAAALCCANSED
jgi:crossover junction endodeoxyribonuclease RuvC